MMPPRIEGRPREGPHDLRFRIDTLGPYVTIRADDASCPAFWVEITVPTWRLLWMALRNAIPRVGKVRIEACERPRRPG